jgi:DNA gyrase/topoisomerase IV subunit B
MHAPDFDSQSKTRLINEWVGKAVRDSLRDDNLYKDIIRKNKDWIDAIYERALARTNKKDLDETKKLARMAKNAKVRGLKDATGSDRQKCIIFIAEGESAISEMLSVRTPEIHGGLPLRGKVLNVHGEAPRKILDNQTLVSIMNAIGLVVGERANRYKLRYGKIYIATDMDPDGANIAALLINFFYTFWPELFDDATKEPFIYLFMSPFIIANKGKTRKYWYANDYHKFNPKEYSGWEITRAKGLGTLTKEDWRHALVSPELLPVTDDNKLKDALTLIFGPDADKRKEWIGLHE